MKEEIKKHFNKIKDSKFLVKFMYGLLIFIILTVVFQAGISVGFRKAQFVKNWGNHYEDNFGPRPPRGVFDKMGIKSPNGHGTIGEIVKIELPNIIVLDRDTTEKIIITNDDTKIISMRDAIQPADLKAGDHIVVIGTPNDDGQIVAKLIRVIPSIMNPNQ